MTPTPRIAMSRALLRTLSAMVLSLALLARASAADGSVSPADLQAAAHTLGFLEGLPREARLVVGVVYADSAPGAQSAAQQAAVLLAEMRGPNAAPLQAAAIPLDDLPQYPDPLHVLYLMPGAAEHAATVVDVIRDRRIVSISQDPRCLETRCCVLLVRGRQRVDIVLDTALMVAVGARFSTVFTLMVRHK
jgi:hypothetical protein